MHVRLHQCRGSRRRGVLTQSDDEELNVALARLDRELPRLRAEGLWQIWGNGGWGATCALARLGGWRGPLEEGMVLDAERAGELADALDAARSIRLPVVERSDLDEFQRAVAGGTETAISALQFMWAMYVATCDDYTDDLDRLTALCRRGAIEIA